MEVEPTEVTNIGRYKMNKIENEIKWKCYRDCDAKGIRKGRIEAWVENGEDLIYSCKCFIIFPKLWAWRVPGIKRRIAKKVAALVGACK